MASGTQTRTSSGTARFAVVAMIVLTILPVALQVRGQQPPMEAIPLERCDRLPVVRVQADGKSLRFLLDTGATSAVNLRRVSQGRLQRLQVSSWSGTTETRARTARIRELTIGRRRLRNLGLPAFDLDAIGRACGGRIDGLLGIDLLEELGATIDLRGFVLRLGEPELPARISKATAKGRAPDPRPEALPGLDRICGPW